MLQEKLYVQHSTCAHFEIIADSIVDSELFIQITGYSKLCAFAHSSSFSN